MNETMPLHTAYLQLLRAKNSAPSRRRGARDIPTPISYLRDQGVSDPAMLFLLYQAHVEHFHLGSSALKVPPRPARPVESIVIRDVSAFTLTQAGELYARQISRGKIDIAEEMSNVAWQTPDRRILTPRYDPLTRQFTWGKHLLKWFRQPAENQEYLLQAAEEQGWPASFDSPLLKVPGVNPKMRLHDVIKALNRNQRRYFIHFMGDGTGTRVGWVYR